MRPQRFLGLSCLLLLTGASTFVACTDAYPEKTLANMAQELGAGCGEEFEPFVAMDECGLRGDEECNVIQVRPAGDQFVGQVALTFLPEESIPDDLELVIWHPGAGALFRASALEQEAELVTLADGRTEACLSVSFSDGNISPIAPSLAWTLSVGREGAAMESRVVRFRAD